jgi:hypothetical protein
MGKAQTLILEGGPCDGLKLRMDADAPWPDAIIFERDPSLPGLCVYRIDPGCLLDMRQCLVSRRRLYRYQPAGAVAEL